MVGILVYSLHLKRSPSAALVVAVANSGICKTPADTLLLMDGIPDATVEDCVRALNKRRTWPICTAALAVECVPLTALR